MNSLSTVGYRRTSSCESDRECLVHQMETALRVSQEKIYLPASGPRWLSAQDLFLLIAAQLLTSITRDKSTHGTQTGTQSVELCNTVIRVQYSVGLQTRLSLQSSTLRYYKQWSLYSNANAEEDCCLSRKKKHKQYLYSSSIFIPKNIFPFHVLGKKQTNSPVTGNKLGSSKYIYNSLWSLFWVRFMGTGFAKG